jgi:hypothetical protein
LCLSCIDYWNDLYSSASYRGNTFAQAGHQHISSPPSLPHNGPRIPSLPLPNGFENPSADSITALSSDPEEDSNGRIARLRSELQGVRTGIRRIVSGLQDLNETTHQQEMAAEGSLPPFTMSTPTVESGYPAHLRNGSQSGVDSSAWSNIPGPQPFYSQPTDRNQQRSDSARSSGHDSPLRVRQRAYLQSDQQRQAMTQHHPSCGVASARNSHRRPRSENPFLPLTQEDLERADYRATVGGMYGQLWDGQRTTESSRQTQSLGVPNASSGPGSQVPMLPNLMMNYPSLQSYSTGYLAAANMNGGNPFMNTVGMHGLPPPEANPITRHTPQGAVFTHAGRWSMGHLAPGPNNRRAQNLSTPDRTHAHPENHMSFQSASDGNRRATNPAHVGRVYGGATDFAGIDMAGPRIGHPFVVPGGLAREYVSTFHGHGHGHGHGHSHEIAIDLDREQAKAMTFDTQDRPPPLEPEDMMVDMSCSICKEHIIDTVVLPCGHAVMCGWCADLQVPSSMQDRTIPKDKSVKCPMCRTRIKQKVKIWSRLPYCRNSC